jgi:hypothetical protein
MRGRAPSEVVTTDNDTFFALASIVADELYGRPNPVLAVEPGDVALLASLPGGQRIAVLEDGTILLVGPYQ